MSKVELLVGLERQLSWLLERHCSFSCAFGVVLEKKGMTSYTYSVPKHCNMGSCRRQWNKESVRFVIVLKYNDIILPPVQSYARLRWLTRYCTPLSYAGHKQHKINIHMYKETNTSSTAVVNLFRLSTIFFLQMMEYDFHWVVVYTIFLQDNTVRWILLLMWLFSACLTCWLSISRLYSHLSKIRLMG